jgi:soluble lytic murein transglycosylase
LDFIELAPEYSQAPTYLFFAGRIAEEYGDLKQAAALWERIGIDYSTSDIAYDGLFQAGIAQYRLGEYDNAVGHFASALGVARTTGEQAGAHFWIGKSYDKLGEYQAAHSSWLQASTSDPTGYYSERALDILDERPPFTPPENLSFNYDKAAEKFEADEWMRFAFSISEEVNLYKLANYLIDIKQYRNGIYATRRVLDLAGYDDAGTLTAPIHFNHIRFGVYYPEIVLPAAQKYNLDPLVFYGMIRHESWLFEPFATSEDEARGLMQIIEITGQDIYKQIQWPPGYTTKDLYRPIVSVTYGAHYFDKQLRNYDQHHHVALAAYNAGPGRIPLWLPLAQNGSFDPDLFVEVIRFEETRTYIKIIYELFTIYKNLYAVK